MKELCDADAKLLLDIPNTYFFIYFTASWCGPCKHLLPLIEELDQRNTNDTLIFYYVDIDENEKLCASFDVKQVPTYTVIKDMKILGINSGSSIIKVGDMLKQYIPRK